MGPSLSPRAADLQGLHDLRVGHDLDGGDPPVHDHELQRGADPAAGGEDAPGASSTSAARAACALPRNARATSSRPRSRSDPAERRDDGVRPQDDVGVQHGEQPGEVASARGGQEGRTTARRRAASAGPAVPGSRPGTRRRARLASWRAAAGLRSSTTATSSNGTAKKVVQHEGRAAPGA